MNRAQYDSIFPPTIDIDKLPRVSKTGLIVKGKIRVQVPVYAAGWTLTINEIIRKYNPPGCINNVSGPLWDKWEELGFDKKYEGDPIISTPKNRIHNSRDMLFIFITNWPLENMKAFQERSEEVFKVMCEVFSIDDPEDIAKIRERYKWHRRGVTDYYPSEEETSANLFLSANANLKSDY
ncbi:hypothetical protein BDQ17DRAFT_1547659 [Cyathus striatus]|nr:hypothetical protein BDQ17DRAFT_1547659 [Cyathus striatus]